MEDGDGRIIRVEGDDGGVGEESERHLVGRSGGIRLLCRSRLPPQAMINVHILIPIRP